MKRIALLVVVVLLLVAAFQKNGTAPDDPSSIGKGLRVLIVEETNANYPVPQIAALNSARSGDIDAWLDTHCAKEKTGETANHVWDKDADVSQQDKFWRDALAKDKEKKLPWITIWPRNGKGFDGQLPATPEELLTLLKKYE